MDELIKGTAEKLSGGEPKASVFARPLPFNLIPHIDSFQVRYVPIPHRTPLLVIMFLKELLVSFITYYPLYLSLLQENGYTKEEMKVVWETQKIFELNPEDVKISCTAVRVPILRAHSEAITLETVRPVTAARAR